jgi:cobalt transporter subunit CbtB
MITSTESGQLIVTTISKGVQLSVLCLLGCLVLFGVGLLPMDALHNAAHDTRHSFAFPCH